MGWMCWMGSVARRRRPARTLGVLGTRCQMEEAQTIAAGWEKGGPPIFAHRRQGIVFSFEKVAPRTQRSAFSSVTERGLPDGSRETMRRRREGERNAVMGKARPPAVTASPQLYGTPIDARALAHPHRGGRRQQYMPCCGLLRWLACTRVSP